MKRKKPTQAEQLKLDWLHHNKRQSNPKLRMTFDEYHSWIFGNSRKRIKAIEKCPTYAIPTWSTNHSEIKSVKSKGSYQASRNTMVERVIQGKIKGDEATEIIAKSNRVGLITSKGAYGYIGDDFDPKLLGKKTQQL